jgi:hypothetical protein
MNIREAIMKMGVGNFTQDGIHAPALPLISVKGMEVAKSESEYWSPYCARIGFILMR